MIYPEGFEHVPRSKCTLRKTHGVGINDVYYQVILNLPNGKQVSCPFYTVWKNMLSRCYSKYRIKNRPKSRLYEFTVCKEWHKLSQFIDWMEEQPWEGENINFDVTMLNPEAKQFNPDNCCFVSKEIVSFFTALIDGSAGYHSYKDGGYEVCVYSRGRRVYGGFHKTPNEARASYLRLKLQSAPEYLELSVEDRVTKALNRYLDNAKEELRKLEETIEGERVYLGPDV